MGFKEITSNEVQTEKDVLVASCGINEEHPEEPKAQILVETKKLDLSSGEEEVIDRIDLYGPIVNCFRNLQHMMLDIQFDSASDPDFIQLVRVLKEFCVPENSLDEESDKLSIVVVTIMPVSLEGEYFAAGVNGSWVVMPSQANRLPDTIRFIFNNIDFHTYRINESELELRYRCLQFTTVGFRLICGKRGELFWHVLLSVPLQAPTLWHGKLTGKIRRWKRL